MLQAMKAYAQKKPAGKANNKGIDIHAQEGQALTSSHSGTALCPVLPTHSSLSSPYSIHFHLLCLECVLQLQSLPMSKQHLAYISGRSQPLLVVQCCIGVALRYAASRCAASLELHYRSLAFPKAARALWSSCVCSHQFAV